MAKKKKNSPLTKVQPPAPKPKEVTGEGAAEDAQFSKEQLDALYQEYLAGTPLEKEMEEALKLEQSKSTFLDTLQWIRQRLELDEWRSLLSDLYYDLSKKDDLDGGAQLASQEYLFNLIASSIGSTSMDNLEGKKDLGQQLSEGHVTALDKRIQSMEIYFWLKLRLAAARIDGLAAAAKFSIK
jgi:hypothetical protein